MKDSTQIKNALWGLLISDSICMPAHWYYKPEYLKNEFGVINGYNDAPFPHPESFMVGNTYYPDIQSAKKHGRPYDILHKHVRFYKTTYNDFHIDLKVHSGEHANLMPEVEQRYHYHNGLKAGENTLGANLVRVLMRSVIKNNGYDQDKFLEDFVEYMTDTNANNDPYLEIYLRDWFENYSKGIAPELCANSQRQRWSIGSHGGIIRPLVLSLTANSSYEGLGIGISHQQLTHSSQNISSSLGVLVPLLRSLLTEKEPKNLLMEFAKQVPLIKIHGEELSKKYFEAKGPGNIPKNDMWKIHTELSDEFLDNILPTATDEMMIRKRFATACYPEHGLPLIFHFLYKNDFDFESSLFDNANAGGDNVHRGMILGLLAGAAAKKIPENLKNKLVEHQTIDNEINNFVKICTT